MKKVLSSGNYTFLPGTNEIRFSGFAFNPSNLYAVINITTGKLIYSVASDAAGYGGNFTTTVSLNDTLIYDSSNVGQSPSDLLQVIYDDPAAVQDVTVTNTVTTNSQTQDAGGNPIYSTNDPVSGVAGLNVSSTSRTFDAYGIPIGSTPDMASFRDGLDVNLLNSSFGGQVGQVLPPPFTDYAISTGFLNSGTLVSPSMNAINELVVDATQSGDIPVTVQGGSLGATIVGPFGQGPMANSIPVTIANNQSDVPMNLSLVGGAGVSLGQKTAINSIPVVQASDTANPVVLMEDDILGNVITGSRNSQLEIAFNTVPSASLLTTTFTGSGSAGATNGHTIFSLGATAGASLARGVSTQIVTYRPGHEIYSMFTAAFNNAVGGTVSHRIGLFDTNDGFFIGVSATVFCIGQRVGGVETITQRTSFNVDQLTGAAGSKFTRNGSPEPINIGNSNLYRIRFAWLGSANIYFEVFSADGQWVLFHNIRQPNSAYNPSIANPNLPMTVEVQRPSGTVNASLATACWAAGTTSDLQPITSTLTDNTLATLNRSVITGQTTAGGGGYVNVKVNPSGALATETTVSGTVATSLPDLYITGAAAQTASGNNALLAVAGTGATDANGYRSGYVQVVSTATSGSYVFEMSADNVNWQTMVVINGANVNGTTISSSIGASASSLIYAFPIVARFIRLRIITGLTGGSIQCFTRLSLAPYQPLLLPVGQASASNLNVVIGSGTVTNVNACSLSAGAITDITSAAITSTQTTSNISVTSTQAAAYGVYVTAISGAGASMDVEVQESLDGSNYFTVYMFERITANGQYYSPVIKNIGTNLRYVRTVSGTTPSITNSIVRTQRSGSAETVRRFINRTIDPNTLNSTTGSFLCEGVEDFNMVVRCTAQTTAATIALQFSMDNTNWFTSGATVTTVNGIAQAKITNEQWKFVRAIVTAAGSGITLGEVTIGGHSA